MLRHMRHVLHSGWSTGGLMTRIGALKTRRDFGHRVSTVSCMEREELTVKHDYPWFSIMIFHVIKRTMPCICGSHHATTMEVLPPRLCQDVQTAT